MRAGTLPNEFMPSEYSPGQLISPPDRPEPLRQKDSRLDRPQVLKKFNWTGADFEAAQKFDFPAATIRPGFCSWTNTPIWSERAVDRWAAERRAEAETLTRLLG